MNKPQLKAVAAETTRVGGIPIQSASEDIWDKKYRLKAKDGTVLDTAVDDTYERIARALANVEQSAALEARRLRQGEREAPMLVLPCR